MEILHLAKANLSKNRSHTISLFCIILIVSMLATIGLSVQSGVMPDYMHNIDRLNSLHNAFLMTQDMYKDSFEEIISTDSRVSAYSIERAVYPEDVSVDYGGKVDVNTVILNWDAPHTISLPEVVEEDTTIAADEAVYLPYYAKSVGYALGDDFTMVYKNKSMVFKVAGFFETNEMSLTTGFGIKLYVREAAFEALTAQIGQHIWIMVRFYNIEDANNFNQEFLEEIDLELSAMGSGSFSMSFDDLSVGSMMPIMLLSTLIITFSFLIAIIALMVIRFRVVNHIDDHMHEIGVLKAAGYTSAQMIQSFLLEYVLVAVPASLLGVLSAIPLFGTIRNAMTSMTGIVWSLRGKPIVGLVTALCITLLVLLMVRLSARKIRTLPPVVALRGGIATYSFRRNFFPLDQGVGGVQTRLGLKNTFSYGKMYVMIGLILAVFSLAVTFMVVMYQNFTLDTTAFMEMCGIEVADITLTVTPHTDADALALEIEEMPEVRKTSMLDEVSIKLEGESVAGFVSNDFSDMETMHAYEGRFPKWDNEIAMPPIMAQRLGKTIGDTVQVKTHGVTQEFIICGLYSTTNNDGKISALTVEGMQRMHPYYRRTSINVYVQPDVTVEDFTSEMENKFGVVNVMGVNENNPYAAAKRKAEEKISAYLEQYHIDSVDYAVMYEGEIIISGHSTSYQIAKINNYQELIQSQLGVFASVIGLTTQFISLLSIMILALILSMTIKSMLTKRRHELGILKAGGFTTKQLMLQLGISFMPTAIIGAVAGCVSGGLLVNFAFGNAFRSVGVAESILRVSPVVLVALSLIIVAVTFTIAILFSIKIRHISAYALLSE